MKSKTCFFTGHRKISKWQSIFIKSRLYDQVKRQIASGITDFVCGGALGFDTMAAIVVLDLRKTYKDIRLILVLPHYKQHERWSDDEKERYELIRTAADKIIYISQDYYDGCYHERNRQMAQQSCTCICFLRKHAGGTSYTVKYAAKNGLEIIYI